MKSGNDNRDQVRTFRVSDDLWEAVKEAAEWRGQHVSQAILRALRQYVAGTRRRRENGEPRPGPRFPSAPISQGGRQRHVRVDDALWYAVHDAAEWRGEHASTVIRRALAQYVAGTDRRRRREEGGG